MLNKYFQQELSGLREIAGEFSKENPAIAPMLGEAASDPDVERLLEGVAFLTGSIRERIDDEFPEIIHDFLRQIWPHYLRPLPASTIIGFSTFDKQKSGLVPKGTYLESHPVDGTKCRFRTCCDVHVPPVEVTEASYQEPPGKNPFIRLKFKMLDTTADLWHVEKLRLYLGGGIQTASNLYHILLTQLNRIIIRNPKTETECILDASYLKPAGFSDEEVLIPYPSNSFQGYRLIQEYFHMPEKFMFLELSGFKNWMDRADLTEFQVELELKNTPPEASDISKVDRNNFILSATPAVNIFSHTAAPVTVDHKKTEYRIRPGGNDTTKYQIYSVEKVYGFIRGIGSQQQFEAFHSFRTSDAKHIYNEKIKRSPVYDRIDFSVNLAYPQGFERTDLKTLSFDILCTNGNLPEGIDHEGISVSTGSTPEFVKFKNLTQPTTATLPPLGTNMLWRLVSLLTINASSLSSPENLKSLLKLYLMKEGSRDHKRIMANEKRIDGIKSLTTKNTERLVKGSMMRGVEIRMKISRNHFACAGDLYLFGMIIDNFLGLYASINTFTKLIIDETETGETVTWPERIGNKQLL